MFLLNLYFIVHFTHSLCFTINIQKTDTVNEYTFIKYRNSTQTIVQYRDSPVAFIIEQHVN